MSLLMITFCRHNVIMGSTSAVRKPLGVRATPEQQRVIAEAAARAHRSVSSFVLNAALQAANAEAPKPRRSPEEVREILAAFRDEVQAHNTEGRDILEDFLADRRVEANRD